MIPNLISAFLLGLISSGHCLGMCGGLMAAAGFQSLSPVLAVGYNIGRLLTYSLLGLLFGVASAALPASALPILMFLSATLLLLTALYLVGLSNWVTYVEKLGVPLWRLSSRRAKSLFPIQRFSSSVLLGLLWGLIPCGLVYTALAFSLSTGSGINAMLAMLAFGLGTFPTMLGTSLATNAMRGWLNRPGVKPSLSILMVALAANLFWKTFGG